MAAKARPMPTEFVMFHRTIAPSVPWSSDIPSRLPAEISAPKQTTKKTISPREIRAWNCGAVKSTNRK